jgi:hypothetical protein
VRVTYTWDGNIRHVILMKVIFARGFQFLFKSAP